MNVEQNKKVKEYFNKVAEEYDLMDEVPYWKLSDELLWYVLKHKIINHIRKSMVYKENIET